MMIRKKRIFPMFILAFALILQGCSSNGGNDGKSADASLASLEITGFNLNPVFGPGTTDYAATVYVEYITVKAEAKHENATVSMTLEGVEIDSNYMLVQNGSNAISVTVKAENGDTRTYSITVTKIDIAGISSRLDDISCDENSTQSSALNPGFEEGLLKYEVTTAQDSVSVFAVYTGSPVVGDDTLTVMAMPNTSDSTVEVNDQNTVVDSGIPVVIPLALGETPSPMSW